MLLLSKLVDKEVRMTARMGARQMKVAIGFSLLHSDTGSGLVVRTAMVGPREGAREASKQV